MNHSTTYSMYYVAIVCPPQVDDKVLQFKHWIKEQFGCIVALKSPAHITLIPPFWLVESKETELAQALQSFKSNLDEVEIKLEDFSHFGRKVLFINVKENSALQELKSQTENHLMHSFGDIIKKDDRPFHPHITVANRDIKPGDFEMAWQHFSKKEFAETFRIKTISLLKLRRFDTRWLTIHSNIW